MNLYGGINSQDDSEKSLKEDLFIIYKIYLIYIYVSYMYIRYIYIYVLYCNLFIFMKDHKISH